MEEEHAFKYCPVCGTKSLTGGKIDGLKCTSCNFDFFLNPKPASVGIIFNTRGEILLTQRDIEPFKGYWDFPSGFIKKGETAEEALRRELKEELDVEPLIRESFCSASDDYLYKGLLYTALDFAFICTFKGELRSQAEISDFSFFSKDNLPEKVSPHHMQFIEKLLESKRLA